jgi:predicted restriction endonuclease
MTERERSERLRQSVDYRCGYCGVREDECGSELEEDHYQPRRQDGADDLENRLRRRRQAVEREEY